MNSLDKCSDALSKIDECAICLDTYDEEPAHLTKCGHLFHQTCLNKLPKPNCPKCRAEITLQCPKDIEFAQLLEIAYSILKVAKAAQAELQKKEEEIALLQKNVGSGYKPEEVILKLVREQIELENAIRASQVLPPPLPRIEYRSFSDMPDKEKAWNEIGILNSRKTTDGGMTTWAKYTQRIKERTTIGSDAEKNLLLAIKDGKIIGYVACYTINDAIPYALKKKLVSAQYVLCSWTAFDQNFQDASAEFELKSMLLKKYTGFSGSFKIHQESSKQILKQFEDSGHLVIQKNVGGTIDYTVYSK